MSARVRACAAALALVLYGVALARSEAIGTPEPAQRAPHQICQPVIRT